MAVPPPLPPAFPLGWLSEEHPRATSINKGAVRWNHDVAAGR
jgi:hypothetical protein